MQIQKKYIWCTLRSIDNDIDITQPFLYFPNASIILEYVMKQQNESIFDKRSRSPYHSATVSRVCHVALALSIKHTHLTFRLCIFPVSPRRMQVFNRLNNSGVF